MANELKTKWIEALRSDEYSQGRGNLKVANCGPDEPADFCCLGVLCDLVDHDKWTEKADGYYLFEGKADYPPEKIMELVGLTMDDAKQLAGFNDDDGYLFEDIADFLENGTLLIERCTCNDEGLGEFATCPECGR